MANVSMEQIVRDVLEQAVRDGLVRRASPRRYPGGTHPQQFTAGDLVGCANLLQKRLRELRTPTPCPREESNGQAEE